MAWPKVFHAICITALLGAVYGPCVAQTESGARAEVFSRQIKGSARLMFSWDSHEKVPFTIERDGDRVILHFENPVRLRWGSTLTAVHDYVRQVESTDGGSTVILTLAQPASARHFRNEESLDIDHDKSGIELVTALKPHSTVIPASEGADATETVEAEEKPIRKYHPHKRKTAWHHTSKKHEEAWIKKSAPSPMAARKNSDTAILANLAPAAGGIASVPEVRPSSTPILPSPAMPSSSLPPQTIATAVAIPPLANPVPPAVVPVIAQTAAPTAVMLITPSPPTPDKAVIPLGLKNDEAAAVFVWQKKLWIVSDSTTPPLSGDLLRAGVPFVGDVQTVANPHAGIIYMPLNANVSASVVKTPSGVVQIVLQTGTATPAQNLMPSITTGSPPAFSIPAPAARQDITFRSPQTGESMHVIPVTHPGAGVGSAQSFVKFTLLQSAQGIVLLSKADDLSVNVQKDAVAVASADGLDISPEGASHIREADTDAALSRLPQVLFPYARWKLDDEKNLKPAEISLMHDIVFNPAPASDKARQKLLGVYLSEGLFPEALGMAGDILRSSLTFYRDHKISALRGAAYLFMYRITDAERDFSVTELKDDPESQMWLALCRELLGEGQETFDFLGNYDRYISHYPPVFIGKLGIIAADRAINRKQYDVAARIFDALKRDNYDEPVKKYVDYMRAKIFSETHDEAEAATIWEAQAKDIDDPLIRTRAEFSLITMSLKSGKINDEQAERRLESIRLAWRGDGLELNVLNLLGNLYLNDKQYGKALHTMRDVVLYFPDVPDAVATAAQMEKIFVLLYNDGGADTMPPLEALALFYEFRDLVPLGSQGDLMIRNLADRLVKIDLLDRAALLLDHQIRNRLSGEDRSTVGAHLARIYLLNHEPDNALDILKSTGYGDLTPDLQLKRLRLTAQALAQQGKADKAIDVISTDNSLEGTQLRLSIYWDNKRWQDVVGIAEDMLGNRSDPAAPLNVPESEVLLKLATAYVYEHDTGQLQYLRDYFTPLMKNNPNRENFRFITSESGAVDYDNLGALDQDIGEIKSYLASSQDKPGKNGLTKLAN